MQLPFTVEQFYDLFSEYNTTVWPAQVFLIALAVAAIGLVAIPRRWSGVGVSAILAFLWAWLGVACHLAFFTAINPLAYGFAGVSIAGALVFLWQGVFLRKLDFKFALNARTTVGVLLIVFALIIYPAWSVSAGTTTQAWPRLASRVLQRYSLSACSQSASHLTRAVHSSCRSCGHSSAGRPRSYSRFHKTLAFL